MLTMVVPPLRLLSEDEEAEWRTGERTGEER